MDLYVLLSDSHDVHGGTYAADECDAWLRFYEADVEDFRFRYWDGQDELYKPSGEDIENRFGLTGFGGYVVRRVPVIVPSGPIQS